jgi:hypothetical protein
MKTFMCGKPLECHCGISLRKAAVVCRKACCSLRKAALGHWRRADPIRLRKAAVVCGSLAQGRHHEVWRKAAPVRKAAMMGTGVGGYATFSDNLDCNVAALTLQQVALHNVDTLCERFAESRCSLQESLL